MSREVCVCSLPLLSRETEWAGAIADAKSSRIGELAVTEGQKKAIVVGVSVQEGQDRSKD